MTLVSIITPVKDRFDLLLEALKSILAQTYKNWEAFIIIDDRLDENTVELFPNRFRNDPRFRIQNRLSKQNGAQVCRNEGVARSQGKYIIFLDSDDILAPFCLEQRVESMEKNPSLDFAVFPTLLFRRTPGDSRLLWNILETDEPDEERFFKQDMPWQTTGPIWRKNAITRLGKWNEILSSFQDWEYHLRACIIGLRYMKFDEPDCFYRVPNGTDSIETRYFEHENIQSRITAFKKISALITEKAKMSRRVRLLLVGLFIRNMVQLLDRDMKTEAKMMLQGACDSKVLRPHDRMLAWRILKEGASWRYRKLIQWWCKSQWPKSIRYDHWDPVSFCSCEVNSKCRALEEPIVTLHFNEHQGKVSV